MCPRRPSRDRGISVIAVVVLPMSRAPQVRPGQRIASTECPPPTSPGAMIADRPSSLPARRRPDADEARELVPRRPAGPMPGWCAGGRRPNSWPCRATWPTASCCSRSAVRPPARSWTRPAEPGRSGPARFAGDLRTAAGYRIYEHGEMVAEVDDVTDRWATTWSLPDRLPLPLSRTRCSPPGCRCVDIEQGRDASCIDEVDCRPAGTLSGPWSCRCGRWPPRQVATAVR